MGTYHLQPLFHPTAIKLVPHLPSILSHAVFLRISKCPDFKNSFFEHV